jgi:hypothetical protein
VKLRSDDDIYRARLVYLGPPGYTLPVHLPYAQWGLGITLSTILVIAAVGLTGNWANAGVGLAAAIFATYYVWQHVDPDRPARKVLKVALTDWRSIPDRADSRALPRLSGAHIRFSLLEHGGDR